MQEELISYQTTVLYKTVIDSEQKYRYTLTREWNASLPKITYIMLNPSIANQLKGDPTMNNCLNFAVDNHYGSIEIVNLFAYRSTNPEGLRKVIDPIGPANNTYIIKAVRTAKTVVLAWGESNGTYKNRDQHVLSMLEEFQSKIYCFEDHSGNAKPKHPLTLKNGFYLVYYKYRMKDNVAQFIN